MKASVMKWICLASLLFAFDLHGSVTYSNLNAQTTIVPYGSNFTYAVAWQESGYNPITYGVNYFSPKKVDPTFYPTSTATNGVFTYTINGVTSADDGTYGIKWGIQQISISGGGPDTSVNMHVSSAILTQPQNTTCLSGSTTTMGIAAGPSTATFQWIDSASGNVIWTGSSFSPTAANNGERVYCKVSNPYGSVSSSSAVLTVGSRPIISSQPASVAATIGGLVTFTVTASGTEPLNFRWFKNGFPLTNANLNSITISPISITDIGTYSVAVTNQFGSTNSLTASLIGSAPTIINQPTNVVTVLGSDATFGVSANGLQPLFYQWFKNGILIQGANLNYIILPSVINADAATYQVAITNAVGNTNSAAVTLSYAVAPQSIGIANTGDAGVTVQFQGTPNFNYAIQATTNLATPINWQSVFTNATDSNGNFIFTDSDSPTYPTRFYRATIP